jgi:integrase
MAMLSDAVHQISEANAILGGSVKHQENRRHLVTPFLRFLRELKVLTRSFADIGPQLVSMYAVHCIISGAKPGHMENQFSAIRVVCRALGNELGETCSNRQLGLPLRVRKGARRAQSQEEIEALLERAARIDQGLVHLIALARLLGLRRMEALMCARDLRMWRDALLNGKTTLHIMRGAKNLRPREVEVLQTQRGETLAAIEAALEFAVARDYELITGRGRTLESALNRLKALLRRAGMTGELSFHSLRYTYSLDLSRQLLDSGVAPYESLVRLSASLGHGSSRAQMILAYYCQPIASRFKGCMKLHKSEAHRRSPATKVPRAAARREAKLKHARMSGFPVGRMDFPTNALPVTDAPAARGTRVKVSPNNALKSSRTTRFTSGAAAHGHS